MANAIQVSTSASISALMLFSSSSVAMPAAFMACRASMTGSCSSLKYFTSSGGRNSPLNSPCQRQVLYSTK